MSLSAVRASSQTHPTAVCKTLRQGNKNDFIDADAIAEAAQMMSAVHRVEQGDIKERTACMSRIGAILLEFGVSLASGHRVMKQLFLWLAEHTGKLPPR